VWDMLRKTGTDIQQSEKCLRTKENWSARYHGKNSRLVESASRQSTKHDEQKSLGRIFSQKNDKSGEPVGAQGVALTPRRSLAVDTSFISLGTPLWLDVEEPALQRLVVAQDTGGAIKGAVRGDLFWGAGSQAEAQAGAMQGKGKYYLLFPKTANPDDETN